MFNKATTRITAILNGGLGNQMFQYATGRALALQRKRNLTLNIGAFQFDKFYNRKYALDAFNLKKDVSLEEEKDRANRFIKLHSLPAQRPYLKGFANLFGFVERPFIYDPYLLKRKRLFSNVLVGYWQDERYFNEIRNDLLSEFTPRSPLSIKNQRIANKIDEKKNIVAIHLRCNHEIATPTEASEPVIAPKAGQPYVLSTRYYEKAIAEIHARVDSPQFIVFSDNPAWVKTNYSVFDADLVLENDRGADWEDLVLMSQCKHHIIANSSFSWWGAWLADTGDQVVMAPKNCPYTPNIPSRWHLID
jgi:hypothetical protein